MNRLFTIIAITLAFAAGALAENGYRAHFYLPSVLAQETGKPFVYHTIYLADSVAEVEAAIYAVDPQAVIGGIEYLGVAETEAAE